MAGFFVQLSEKKMLNKYAPILDWILQEKKFQNWEKTSVLKFTKKVKKLNGIGKENFIYENKSDIIFSTTCQSTTIILARGDGIAKTFCRHIRNGIAHEHAKICTIKGRNFIEIKDFSSSSSSAYQTAYILMPLSFLKDIYDIYQECLKSAINIHKRKRKVA